MKKSIKIKKLKKRVKKLKKIVKRLKGEAIQLNDQLNEAALAIVSKEIIANGSINLLCQTDTDEKTKKKSDYYNGSLHVELKRDVIRGLGITLYDVAFLVEGVNPLMIYSNLMETAKFFGINVKDGEFIDKSEKLKPTIEIAKEIVGDKKDPKVPQLPKVEEGKVVPVDPTTPPPDKKTDKPTKPTT